MEMNLREWLFVLGIVIIALVVIDGLRRVRRARQDSKTIAEGMGGNSYNSPIDEDFNPELPGQGFRVIRKGEDSDAVGSSNSVGQTYPEHAEDNAEHEDRPDFVSPESGWSEEPVHREPYISDTEDSNTPELSVQNRVSPELTSADSITAYDGQSAEFSAGNGQGTPGPLEVETPLKADSDDRPHGAQLSGDDFKERFLKKISSNAHAGNSKSKTSRKTGGRKKHEQKAQDVDEVIVVNVLAKGDELFDGEKLRHLVEACGMQIGEMSIYHRHEYDFNKGPVQFSMANVVQPGTFGSDFRSTPGVCFFVRLPGPDESMQAFDYMIETAQCVVRNLGGELKDENHSVMTAQTIEHCRQRVREFERRQLSQR